MTFWLSVAAAPVAPRVLAGILVAVLVGLIFGAMAMSGIRDEKEER